MQRHAILTALLLSTVPFHAHAQTTVGAAQANSVVGQGATVCGKVESFRFSENLEGQPTFLHLGGAFPRHTFTVRINGADRARFDDPEQLVGRMICVTGNVAFAQGNVPEMLIRAAGELTLM